MGGKIDCYVDVVSWYSYIAFVELLANRQKLAAHGVELEFHPVFLGGIMKASGNNPPWLLPARGKFFAADSLRVAARAGLPHIRFPPNFMAVSNSVMALRALHFIRANHPPTTFLTAFRYLSHVFFTPPHTDVSRAEGLAEVLRNCPAVFDGVGGEETEKLFGERQVEEIMEGAASAEMKESLRRETGKALEKGAFGAPWMVVRNGVGEEVTFFGSDRFLYVYEHLGLPVRGVEILGPEEARPRL